MTRAGCLGWLSICACLPGSPPTWLLQEEPEVVAMQVEGVAAGPHSADLLPIPADRTRSDGLPGDTVRVTALAANVDGLIDLGSLDTRWFLSHRASVAEIAVATACEVGAPLEPRDACVLGGGPEIEFVVPPLPRSEPINDSALFVWLVAGWRRSTEACLGLLEDTPGEGTVDCLIAHRRLTLGPLATLAEIAIAEGIPLPAEVDPAIPPAAFRAQPNFAPEVPSVLVLGDGHQRRVWAGERLTLPPDAAFELTASLDPRDEQLAPMVDSDGQVTFRNERTSSRWHATAEVFDQEKLVTDDAFEGLLLIVVATDSRESQSWSVFEFDVSPE